MLFRNSVSDTLLNDTQNLEIMFKCKLWVSGLSLWPEIPHFRNQFRKCQWAGWSTYQEQSSRVVGDIAKTLLSSFMFSQFAQRPTAFLYSYNAQNATQNPTSMTREKYVHAWVCLLTPHLLPRHLQLRTWQEQSKHSQNWLSKQHWQVKNKKWRLSNCGTPWGWLQNG